MRTLGITAPLLPTANALSAQTVASGRAGPREKRFLPLTPSGVGLDEYLRGVAFRYPMLRFSIDKSQVQAHGDVAVLTYVARYWSDLSEFGGVLETRIRSTDGARKPEGLWDGGVTDSRWWPGPYPSRLRKSVNGHDGEIPDESSSLSCGWRRLRPASVGAMRARASGRTIRGPGRKCPPPRVKLSHELIRVSPLDVTIYGMVALGFFALAMLACWAPVRRATRVDPAIALRARSRRWTSSRGVVKMLQGDHHGA